MGFSLPGGFSPVKFIQQAGSIANPTGGVADYDVFAGSGTQQGGQRVDTTGGVAIGTMSFSDGQLWRYDGTGWKSVNSVGNSPATEVGGQVQGSYTGGSSRPAVDAQQIALYDQGINQTNAALSRLLGQENVGNQNIEGDYTTGLNALNTQRARAEADYNENRVKTTKDNVAAKSNIAMQTGQQANAIQRLLGQRGAGSSSAARIVAPYAAALQGTQQRQQVQDAYAENIGGLDKSWNLFNEDWNSSREDLDTQKFRQQNALKADIAGKRTSLLSSLAQLQQQRAAAAGGNPAAAAQSYIDQINQIESGMADLGAKYRGSVAAKTPTYAAPDLAKYDYTKAQAPQFQDSSAYMDSISPAFQTLLNKKKEQLN